MRRRRTSEGPNVTGGPRVRGYEALVPLASGGSSTVYRGHQSAFDRTVAVKILSTPLRTERDRRRFARELALTGRLTGHPNIVIPLDHGYTDDGRPFVVTPWYPGGSLADRLTYAGLEVTAALRLGIRLAGALQTAHAAGIIHRDVKPGNVLLAAHGEPALADFGIAVTVAGTQATDAMTPAHAAPEVLENQPATAASDVWSLGSTIWTALVGRPPFEARPGEGLLPTMLRLLHDPVPSMPRNDVPSEVVAAVERCMAKRPDERWPSAEAFGMELQRIQARLGESTTELVVAGPADDDPEVREPHGAQPDDPDMETTTRPGVDAPRPPQPGPPKITPPWEPSADPAPPAIPPEETIHHPHRDDATEKRRRRWLVPAALGGVAGLVFVAGLLYLIWPEDEPSPRTAPEEQVVRPEMPSQLTVEPEPTGAVHLTWLDPNDGEMAYVVQVYQQGEQVVPATVADADGLTIPDLEFGDPYCFVVSAVVAFGSPAETGPIKCINGDVLRLPAAPTDG